MTGAQKAAYLAAHQEGCVACHFSDRASPTTHRTQHMVHTNYRSTECRADCTGEIMCTACALVHGAEQAAGEAWCGLPTDGGSAVARARPLYRRMPLGLCGRDTEELLHQRLLFAVAADKGKLDDVGTVGEGPVRGGPAKRSCRHVGHKRDAEAAGHHREPGQDRVREAAHIRAETGPAAGGHELVMIIE